MQRNRQSKTEKFIIHVTGKLKGQQVIQWIGRMVMRSGF